MRVATRDKNDGKADCSATREKAVRAHTHTKGGIEKVPSIATERCGRQRNARRGDTYTQAERKAG